MPGNLRFDKDLTSVLKMETLLNTHPINTPRFEIILAHFYPTRGGGGGGGGAGGDIRPQGLWPIFSTTWGQIFGHGAEHRIISEHSSN